MKAEHELNNLSQNSNSVVSFRRKMKKEGKDLKRGRCLRPRYDRLCFIVEDRSKSMK